MDLQVPATVGAMLDVNGIVEIARSFAVNGDDGQVAKIFAAGALGFANGLRATLGFVKDFGGEDVREMMLANDDFRVDTEIAGAAENFDDAADWRCASVRITEQLDVDDGAVEFIEAGNTPQAQAGLIRAAESELLRQARRQFVAAGDLNFVLDANVVWQDNIVLSAVAKKTDDRGMRAVEDSNDAAFGALRASDAAQTLNFCENVIAVHGVLDGVARDEDVAVELRHGRIGDDEAVAVVVKNEAAFDFVAAGERGGLGTARSVAAGRFLAGRIPFRFAAREAVAAARQFLDGAALLELGKHFEEWAIVGLFQVEALGDVAGGRGRASNLQKTQYVIGT
jgi:hypothetical protein